MIKANKSALIVKYRISIINFTYSFTLHENIILEIMHKCLSLCLCNKVFASREIPWMQKIWVTSKLPHFSRTQIKWFDALIANIWVCHSLNPLNYVNLIFFLKYLN